MTDTVPAVVDATDLPDEPDESVDVFAAPDAPESPYAFAEAEWPEKPKVESKPRPANPFQAKVEAMLATGGLPTGAVTFTAVADDEKTIRGQIQRAAGDRATGQIKVVPADEGKITVTFRLVDKIHRKTSAAPVGDAPSGGPDE